MTKFSLLIILTISLIWMVNCSEETIPVATGEKPVISETKVPAFWSTHSSKLYRTEVWVKDPQGPANLRGVYLSVHENDGDNQIFADSLYDDGAYFNKSDGDVIAGDGVFSNRFQAIDIVENSDQTEFIFRFQAFDKQNNISEKWENLVNFSPNSPPVIHQIFAPDSISFRDENVIFSITVSDSDGIDDINRAYFESEDPRRDITIFEKQLFDDGDFENHGDLVSGDSTYSNRITSRFLVAKKGVYNLIFRIEDLSEEQNIEEAIHPIYVENFESQFVEINVPDVFDIPSEPGQQFRELITVEVSDPESLADVDSVYFYSLKPDSTFAQGGLPFIMVDNGLPFNPEGNIFVETGDEEFGDGIFSLSIFSDSETNPGEYTFSFYIRDRAGNLSGPVERKIQLVE